MIGVRKKAAGQVQKRRCVVHFGLNKTGSTTIQAWMAHNSKNLEKQGIRYETLKVAGDKGLHHLPGFPAIALNKLGKPVANPVARRHLKLNSVADQEPFVQDFIDRAEASIARPGYHTYVISSESFFAKLRTPEDVSVLHDWLTERFDDVVYVAYMRDQINWIPSAYNQHVKGGGTLSLDDYVKRNGKQNYNLICRSWSRAVGRRSVTPRLLEAGCLKDDDLIADFADILGADISKTSSVASLNVSMAAEAIEKLRQKNIKAKENGSDLIGAQIMRSQFANDNACKSSKDKLALSDQQAAMVAKMNAKSNENLRARHFAERPYLFKRSHDVLALLEASR